MTVAAVILAPSPADALADAEGTPAVRRIAAAAWAGGATPVVVACPDPGGAVAAALGTAEAVLAEAPADAVTTAALLSVGLRAATDLVAATSAALVWPASHAWADAETATTLIEAHGLTPRAVLRPAYAGVAGWPALLPVAALERLEAWAPPAGGSASAALEAALAWLGDGDEPVRLVDSGDPGTTHDIAVLSAARPPFDGPPPPDDGVEREWGADVVARSDTAPRSGRPDPASRP